jgi:isopentenyl-diphosphate delta-isomerase
MREVVLTDTQGNETGLAEIVDAHTGEGKLHRAFSIYVFRNDRKEVLIQQRSADKMLFPLIWANTCCSHPFPGEAMLEAGKRRLQEECGIECALEEAGSLVYRAEDPNGRGVEHEHVTLLTGNLDEDAPLLPNPEEIAEIKWMNTEKVLSEMKEHPETYAPWFHLGLTQLLAV